MRPTLSLSGESVSTKPDPPCTRDSIIAAKRDQVRERASVMRLLPPVQRDQLVDAFLAHDVDAARRPPPAWRDLQRQESSEIDIIAEAALGILFGTRSRVTPKQAGDLEQGATYLIRRMQPIFVQAAQEHAANTLLSCSEFQVATVGKSPAEKAVMAHRIVMSVRASLHAVLEATTPLFPSLYLKAEQAKDGGR